jgi:hypothetical protein
VLKDNVVPTILRLSANQQLSFSERSTQLGASVLQLPSREILRHLDYAGVIPEAFGHDSTEEKLFAKYCDFLLAAALTQLGLHAEVIEARGESADVSANSSVYKMVGDAKAFRLSRTAKNQKDFKVESLSQWRGDADYAVLVAPHYQYPSAQSQIYAQAARYRVTLVSYAHVAFLLRHGPPSPEDLQAVWQAPLLLEPSNSASDYWQAIERAMLEICRVPHPEWREALRGADGFLAEQALTQVEYWNSEKRRIRQLSHQQAVRLLIDSMKIDSKISTIAKTAGL